MTGFHYPPSNHHRKRYQLFIELGALRSTARVSLLHLRILILDTWNRNQKARHLRSDLERFRETCLQGLHVRVHSWSHGVT